jgi:hypothetical protein
LALASALEQQPGSDTLDINGTTDRGRPCGERSGLALAHGPQFGRSARFDDILELGKLADLAVHGLLDHWRHQALDATQFGLELEAHLCPAVGRGEYVAAAGPDGPGDGSEAIVSAGVNSVISMSAVIGRPPGPLTACV